MHIAPLSIRSFRSSISISTPYRRSISTSSIVQLASTRHDPPSPASNTRPPILVMHGLFGSQRNNRTFSKTLAKQLSRVVYTLDLRNHGESLHHPVHNYTVMAEDVEAFIKNHTEIKTKPILIGHSMGAKVAMTLALRQPDKYSGIVPLDNAPVDAALRSDFGKYIRAMLEVENATPPITRQSDADAILAKYEKKVEIRQFLLTNFVKDPNDKTRKRMHWRIPLTTIARQMDQMGDFPFKDPDQVRYEGPCLVIRGSDSKYVADETLPIFGRFFPRFEVVDVKAGHWVVSEAFEETTNAVVEWVRRVVDQDRDSDS